MVSLSMIVATFIAPLFILLTGGIWIAVVLGVVAVGNASYFVQGGRHLILYLTFGSLHSFILSAAPVFILMGEILFYSGISDRLYRGLQGVLSRLPAGLLHVNVAASAIFAAVCGSSLAEVSALAPISIPALEKRGYNRKWSMGSLAAAGSLGMMIPPSIPLIIYGIMTNTSIAKLFVAGIIPGIVLAFMFSLRILVQVLRDPDSVGGVMEKVSFIEGLKDLSRLTPMIVLIFIVLGSIYMGIATPTESAGIGVIGALIIAALYRSLTWRSLRGSLKDTTIMWGSVGFIVIAAQSMSLTLSYLGVTDYLTTLVVSLQIPPLGILFGIYFLYILLGCVMDGLSMIVVTVPITFSVVTNLGFDAVWFGIVLVLLIEIAVITPPIGPNLWVLQAYTGESIVSVARSALPFLYVMLVFLLILTFLPELATWLPSIMW